MKKKLLIFIISYKASYRVLNVYKKIPFKKLKKYKTKLLISDDASKDDTIYYAKKIKNKNIWINQNKKNIGYGAHIKKCLNFSIKKNFDYAVMIHGDGQYDPKYIPNLIKKIESEKNVGAATGSRTLGGLKRLLGNMPYYKVIGNIVLTNIFNFLMNKNYSDAHTGLWAYNLKFLKNKKFNYLTNGFNFDQEFRFRNILSKKTIKEIPIKAKYGDERSQLHINYAIQFLFNTLMFFLIKKNLFKSIKFK
tara:strand:+ start:252 stop:998 length:747 start_codon:yes stop_codon:yes gene_type:complete